MKKLFTLIATMVFAFALSANAQGTKKWDFTKWSASTVSQVLGAEDWTKAESDSKNYITGDEIRWVLTTNFNEDGELMAAGMAIEELKGLRHNGLAAYGLALAFNYTTTLDANKWGPYASPSYLWICGNKSSIIVPEVKAGSVFKLGVESHKPSEGRGFKLTVAGEEIAAQTSKEYAIVEYAIPEGAEEYVEVTLTATKGCHLYSIEAEVKDVLANPSKVGYIYTANTRSTFEELPLYNVLQDLGSIALEPIKVNETLPTNEALMAYDAVIIDGGIAVSDAIVAFLKENIYWQPVVNFSGKVAEALGFGEAIANDNEIAWAVNKNHRWLRGFEGYDTEDGMFAATSGNILPVALKLTAHAGNEAVISWGTETEAHKDSVIAYTYNQGHNAYIYYGIAGDYSEATDTIIENIIIDAIDSKADVTAATSPTFNTTYKHQQTFVTLACENKNAKIYYTTDGSEPTVASTMYAGETLEFTKEAVINAIAVADGYTLSEMSSYEVKLYNQAKAPSISLDGNAEKGDVVITLTSEEEGVDIWYNFTGSADSLYSSKYNGPITIKRKAEITAFAISDSLKLVQSDLTTDSIFANMKNVRRDELAHFSANGLGYDKIENFTYDGVAQTAWANSSKYYFSWGKTAAESFTKGDPVLDANGEPLFDEAGNPVFETTDNPICVAQNINDPTWSLTSQGQVMIYQGNGVGTKVGDFTGYNPERAEDLIEEWATAACVQFGGIPSGDKYNAAIRTNVKFAGPFNVITVVANVNGNKTTGEGNPKKVAVQVSKDGVNWETVGDTLITAAIYRNYKTFEVSYEGTEEVYVRLASILGNSQAVHDIYILNKGEKSKAEEANYTAGIEDVLAPELAPVKARKVIKDGKLLIVTAKGVYNLTGVQVK